jgi:competence protein CoiA
MATCFLMGALNKYTNSYEYPLIANKNNKYICPDCKKDVILRKGDIRIHHFAHYKEENPCNYYIKPNESQIHKEAKLLLKALLDTKREIHFKRKCNRCSSCEDIKTIDICKEQSSIELEYRFN